MAATGTADTPTRRHADTINMLVRVGVPVVSVRCIGYPKILCVEKRTRGGLREAITAARHGWVKRVSEAEQDSWITMPQTSKKFQTMEPKWFNGEFSKLIEIAFRGRIILTQQEASARFRKTSRREITEDE